MTALTDFLNSLRKSAWVTAGARYNASRRLRLRDRLATFSISCFSGIAILLVIYQKTYSLAPGGSSDNYVTALSAFIGVFVIIISLVEWGSGNAVKADTLYRNAERLGEFQRRVEIFVAAHEGQVIAKADADGLLDEYERIKRECSANHEPIDHRLFLVQQRFGKEFEGPDGTPEIGWLYARWVNAVAALYSVWYFAIQWLIVLYLVAAITVNH